MYDLSWPKGYPPKPEDKVFDDKYLNEFSKHFYNSVVEMVDAAALEKKELSEKSLIW